MKLNTLNRTNTKKIRVNLHQTDDNKTFFSQPSFDWGEILAMFGKSTFLFIILT